MYKKSFYVIISNIAFINVLFLSLLSDLYVIPGLHVHGFGGAGGCWRASKITFHMLTFAGAPVAIGGAGSMRV